jgi:hypothetical protein
MSPFPLVKKERERAQSRRCPLPQLIYKEWPRGEIQQPILPIAHVLLESSVPPAKLLILIYSNPFPLPNKKALSFLSVLAFDLSEG